ncbi:hypothetical protein A2U01_0030822, partial [Trifolium medium]|nr:hypothetical protein [Trifolium medium]
RCPAVFWPLLFAAVRWIAGGWGGAGGCDGSELEVMRGVVVSLYRVDLVRVGVDCLETDCELKLICLGFHSTVVPSIFGSRELLFGF